MKTQIREIESTRFLLIFASYIGLQMDDFPWMGLVESYIGLQMDDFHWMGLVESAIHLLVRS